MCVRCTRRSRRGHVPAVLSTCTCGGLRPRTARAHWPASARCPLARLVSARVAGVIGVPIDERPGVHPVAVTLGG